VIGSTNRLWPEINNPHLRGVLAGLFPQAQSDAGSYEAYVKKLPERFWEYQRWVRSELAVSGIAERIAAGGDWLPRLEGGLPPRLSRMMLRRRPQSDKALARYLSEFLAAILDPARTPSLARRAYNERYWIAGAGAIVLAAVIVSFTLPHELGMLGTGLLTATSALCMMLCALVSSNNHDRQINSTELYWYLTAPPTMQAMDHGAGTAPG
jgi:hypothetical protein